MSTCLVRYDLDSSKLDEFEEYARAWMALIEKYGGTHHGYFIPASRAPQAEFSFGAIGREGSDNVGVALFSFPDIETYENYRRDVKNDPECVRATSARNASECFISYERSFLEPVKR